MKRAFTINLEKDISLAIRLQGAALLLIIPFAYLFYLPASERFSSPWAIYAQPIGLPYRFLDIILLLSMVFLTLLLHELVHAAFFKLLGPKHIRVIFGFSHGFAFAGAPNAWLPRGRYLVVGMGPALVISAACLLGMYLLPAQAAPLVYTTALINASGSVGDYYISYRILRSPPGTLVRDTGVEFIGYTN